MCLIVHRPKARTQIPAPVLTGGITQNPDGWGIMYAEAGRIHIKRGLDKASFWNALDEAGDRPLSVHFRWATHGTKTTDNCHPFLIVDGRYAVMHNGILDIPTKLSPGASDTFHFAHLVLDPLLRAYDANFGHDDLTDILDSIVGASNKLAILREDGESVIVNRGRGTKYQGLWLSNTNSLPWSGRDKRPWREGKWELVDGKWVETKPTPSKLDQYYDSLYAACEARDELAEFTIPDEPTKTREIVPFSRATIGPRHWREWPRQVDDLVGWSAEEIKDYIEECPDMAAEMIEEHVSGLYDIR